LPRRQAACAHARQRAFGGTVGQCFRTDEIAGAAHAVIPVIALHALFAASDQRQRQRMPRAALASDKAMRVRIHRHALARLHPGAVGVGNTRVCAADLLDLDAQLDRPRGVDIPRMPQVEIGEHRCHARRIGQARCGIGLGVARNRAGLIERGLDRIRMQVGGAG
jgi:hypothetical protein